MDNLEQKLKALKPEEDKDILLLELHRLMKRGAIDFRTYERAKIMWGI
ncbi:MAG: hypothetical protein ABSF88_09080 [Candidatus Aminicenantales bacterium]